MPRDVYENWVDPRTVRTRTRIEHQLKVKPMTAEELCKRLGLSVTAIHYHIRRMLDEKGLIHVSGWERTGGRAFRVYTLGPGEDVPFVGLRFIRKGKTDMTEISCKVLVEALKEPQSAEEVAKTLNCSPAYARKYINILLKEKPRRIYIMDWRHPNGKGALARIFAAGSKRDKPKPKLTCSQRFAELKADKEKHERALLLRRLAAARRRNKNTPASIFAALGI